MGSLSQDGAPAATSPPPRRTARVSWPVRVLIASAVLVAIAAMVVAGGWSSPTSQPAAAPATKVVMFGIPHLGLDDLNTGLTPNLDRLVRTGAMASATVRTQSTAPLSTEAYASLGAGNRVSIDPAGGADQAYRPADPVGDTTAARLLQQRSGRRPHGDVVVVGAPQAIQGAGDDTSSRPGALGDALHRAHLTTGVVGNADTVSPTGARLVSRPTAVALMDSAGSVDHGEVGPALTRRDPAAPFGIRAEPNAVLAAAMRTVARSDVVIVDPGDTERAATYDQYSSQDAADAARRTALRRTDALLSRLAARLPRGTLLLVVAPMPPKSPWALPPMVASGAGVRQGSLYSVSTKRVGLVTLTDLAPTVLASLGAPTPSSMIGAPLRYHTAPVDVGALRRQDAVANAREGLYYPLSSMFLGGQAIFFFLALFALRYHPERARVWARFGVTAIAAWPLATYLDRAIPGVNTWHGAAAEVVIWSLAFLAAAAATRARRHPLSPLAWICGVTLALLLVDVATGARLEMSSVLGYSPYNAARFTGIGNTTLGLVAGCAILAATIHIHASSQASRRADGPDRLRTERTDGASRARLVACAGLVVVLAAAMLPMLGNKVGSIFTLLPSFGLLAQLLYGRRLSYKAIGLTALGTAAVLVLMAGLDLLRPAAQRTHLGRFADDLLHGDNTASTTVIRKLQTNLRVSQSTVWLWMIPIAIAVAFVVLVVEHGWRDLTPAGSPLRAGLYGLLAAAAFGWLTNDSGVIVPALTVVYVGPFLALLLLAHRAATAPAPAPAVAPAETPPVPVAHPVAVPIQT